jgi:hypothetical protein
MFNKHLALIISLLVLIPSIYAQRRAERKPLQGKQDELIDNLRKAKADVIKATNQYKASLEKLIPFEQAQLKNAAETLARRKELFALGIISKAELDKSERQLADAQARLDETRRQIAEADNLIAEVSAEDQLLKFALLPNGAYRVTAALIRYNGTAKWTLSDAAKVESFFIRKLGRQLPVSAFGQTSVHERMGFDHHNAIDVAVHPDSAEGQALMAYLRSQGIPFIAFRQAVAGAATGAHIHIGKPSHRIAAAAVR